MEDNHEYTELERDAFFETFASLAGDRECMRVYSGTRVALPVLLRS